MSGSHDTTIRSATISVLVDNEAGILARVTGLFTGRGYNIDSLTVAERVVVSCDPDMDAIRCERERAGPGQDRVPPVPAYGEKLRPGQDPDR